MALTSVIVGLGNPGPEYALTRHNLGFWAVDRIAGQWRIKINRSQSHALSGSGEIRGRRVVLAKPQTYMNLSGKAVKALLAAEHLDPLALLVLHDDMDIALGRVKLKTTGGDAGHNGVASVIRSLGTGDFSRLRIGLGRRPEGVEGADWVLSPFLESELEEAESAVEMAAVKAVEWLLKGGRGAS